MNHILLISENRVLLKQLYTYLEGRHDFVVHVVSCSSIALERFSENKGYLIFLDTDVAIPYQTILHQLQQSKRNYRVILLSDSVEPKWDDPRVQFHNKNSLTPEDISNLLQNISKDVQEDETMDEYTERVKVTTGHFELVLYPDTYCILFVKYVGVGTPEIDKCVIDSLKTAMGATEGCEAHLINSRDLLLLFRKSKIRSGFELTKLFRTVFKVLGQENSIIYGENISWRTVESVCSQIQAQSQYAYFLKQESIEFNALSARRRELSRSQLREPLTALLRSILLRDFVKVKSYLNEIYMNQLKNSMDFNGLAYTRCNVQIITYLVSSAERSELGFEHEAFSTVEMEFDVLCQKLNSFIKESVPRPQLNPLLITAVMDMYQRYSEDISLAGIAQDLDVNKVYLSRLFREHIGITVLDMLQTIRIQNAKFLLQYTDLRVSDISNEVGYIDAGYFSRLFKRETNMSPQDFRSYMKDRREFL